MNQVKAGAILNYVIIGLNTIVGLAYTPYMLRCLGQNEYGLYSLVASVIAYLTILDFGFGNAIIRYTAKYRAEGKWQAQWEMFGMFLIVYSIIGLVAFCGGLGLYYNVDALFDRTMSMSELNQARIMMILLTCNLAFTFPLSIFGSIISAYENFVFQRIINILRIILSTGVLILVLAVGYKAVALVVVQTSFNLLTLIINFIYCKKELKIRIIFGKFDLPFVKEISIYSFWIFLNAIMDKIYWGTGQFVLGAVSGTIAVAVFSVAILFQQMYMQFSTSIASVLLPKVTAMVTTEKDDRRISELFIKTGRLQCLIMTFILSGFIVFGQGFIDIWAGDGYSVSYVIALIFFVALFIPLI
ncbi:MAG: oligosaccharide flippase family protein, partial [Muribaculaceae bacterium]|nr:oligosaccharide flippase family protein [Muribaculaceae bacterium]